MNPRIPHRPWYCPTIQEVLAVLVVVGGGYILYTKPDLESAMTLMLGTVIGYYFGSSQDSHKKTELLAKAQPVEKKGCCHD